RSRSQSAEPHPGHAAATAALPHIQQSPPSRPCTRRRRSTGPALAVWRYLSAPPRPYARPQFESLSEPPEMPKKEYSVVCRSWFVSPFETNLHKLYQVGG